MLTKPSSCSLCPLYKIGQGFCPDETRANPRLLLQLEAPGKDEIDQGLPTVGKAGWWLWFNIMNQIGVTRDECVITNTLRCLPPITRAGEHYPVGKIKLDAEKCCRQYDILDRFDKSIPLMLFGNHAMSVRLGFDSVQKWRGHITTIGDRLTSCTYHPSAVLRQPNLLPVVVSDITNLFAAADNSDCLKRPVVHKCQRIDWE